ncbi:MAG: fumarylacetoacetase [Phycisphaerales bacterium]|nr:fumarylacetoacetase [Phycisphaerales bacterium]
MVALDDTHQSHRTSWEQSAQDPGTDFPIQNLPFAVMESAEGRRIVVGIGDKALDMHAAVLAGVFDMLSEELQASLRSESLNELMALGPEAWRGVRVAVGDLLDSAATPRPELLRTQCGASLVMPVEIRDYTDFYAARHHATNVGRMFRPDGDPLLPNYLHLPVGYHGRASSIVVSGTPIKRPCGQTKPEDAPPTFGPCRLLDYELELGAFVGTNNPIGERVAIGDAMDHLFGVVILNDWSARDVQKWEYQPLGPFNAKNFASTISPWVVTMDALAPFRMGGPERESDDPAVLEYLLPVTDDVLDISVEASLSSAGMREQGMAPLRLSRGSAADLTWSFAQMLAHHTSTGCPMSSGDLLGSGTISGSGAESRGCLLELTWRGTEPLDLPDGTQRRFLQDGDEVIIKAWCEREGARRIGFGVCRGLILPA